MDGVKKPDCTLQLWDKAQPLFKVKICKFSSWRILKVISRSILKMAEKLVFVKRTILEKKGRESDLHIRLNPRELWHCSSGSSSAFSVILIFLIWNQQRFLDHFWIFIVFLSMKSYKNRLVAAKKPRWRYQVNSYSKISGNSSASTVSLHVKSTSRKKKASKE